MAQSSLGYLPDDEEERTAALPLATEDRASTNLRSPAFQLAAPEPEPPPVAAPAPQPFGTSLAGALGDFRATAPEQEQPAQPEPQADTSEPARRLMGADSPAIGQALAGLDQQPVSMRENPRFAGPEWQQEADRRTRENDAQKSGIHAYLRSKGIVTDVQPDGSHTIATHEDGTPMWKPARSQPFTDPETGRPVVRERDDRGNLADVDLFATRGIVKTDPATGARYYMGPGNQPVDLNAPDPAVARMAAVKALRSDLFANEQLASHEIQRIRDGMVDAQTTVRTMDGMAAGGSEYGGTAKSVAVLKNLVRNLTPLVQRGVASEDDQQKLKDAQDNLERHYQDFPEHRLAEDAVAGATAQIATLDAARKRDSDRRFHLLMDPSTSSAVAAAQPSLQGNAGSGEVETAQVDQDTAQAAAAGRTTQSLALPGVLRRMQASGVQFLKNPAGEMRSINDAIAEARNPPARVPEKAPRPNGTLYTVDDKGALQFDHEKPADALRQALEDGKADPEWAAAHMPEFQEVQKRYDALQKSAGSAQVVKALLKGGGRGAAFLAGASPGAAGGAALLSETGPGALIGGAIGGLITGTAATWGYDKLMQKLGDYSSAVKSMNDSAELHPVANSAGELVAFGASGPKSIMNLAKAARLAKAGALAEGLTEAAGSAAARKVVATQLASGAVGGAAFEGVLRPAFDAARYKVADQLGIEHGDVQAPDTDSMLTNIALGVLTASHGMRFQKFSAEDLTNILGRAEIRESAGIKPTDKATPKAITAAYAAHGITMDAKQAAGLSGALPQQEVGLRSALQRQQAQLEKAGAFKGFTGAEQAQGPGHLAALGQTGEEAATAPPSAAPAGPTGPASPTAPSDSDRSSAEPAPTGPAGQAKAFSATLRAKDAIGPRLTEEQAGGAFSAATNDELAGHDQTLHGAQKAVTEQVPAPVRQRLAAIVGGDAGTNEAHFAGDPDAPFAAAHVGKELRDTYATPEQQAALDQTVARAGEHAPVAQFVADQHVGMRAAKDLLDIATGRAEVPAERMAELGRLGLVETGEDGRPAVTHDALPLLPKGLTARLTTAPERFRVRSLHGEKLEGAAAIARNGQGQLEDALHAKALTAREQAAPKSYPVRVEFTDHKGEAREKVIRGQGRTPEEGMAHAMAITEKRGMKVTHAEHTTAEKEAARKAEQPRPLSEKETSEFDYLGNKDNWTGNDGPRFSELKKRRDRWGVQKADPLTRNRIIYTDATDAERTAYTPEQRQALARVESEFARNRGLFKQFGIERVTAAKADGEASGIATSTGKLSVDPMKLLEQLAIVKQRAGHDVNAGKKWVRNALMEEVVHQATIKGLGPKWVEKLKAAWNDPAMTKDMRDAAAAHAAETYDGFENLDDHQKAAEFVRMVVQGRWKRGITEQVVNIIRDLHAYLTGLKVEHSPLLQEAIDRTRAALIEARKQERVERREERERANAEPQPPAEPSASSPPVSPKSSGPHPNTPEEQSRPSPEPATPAAEAQAEPEQPARKPNFKFTLNDGGFSQDPIVARIMEHGGLLSRTALKKQWGAEKYATNAGESEDAATMAHPSHNAIYSKDGMTPDEAVAVLHGDGQGQPAIVREGFSTADLWAHLDRASRTAKDIMTKEAGMKKDAAAQRQMDRAFTKDTATKGRGEKEVTAWDVNPGDTVQVGTEAMKVVSVDAANNSFVLEDGHKYGTQEVEGHMFGKLERSDESLGAARAKKDSVAEYLDLHQSLPDGAWQMASEGYALRGRNEQKAERIRQLEKEFPGGALALSSAAMDLQSERVQARRAEIKIMRENGQPVAVDTALHAARAKRKDDGGQRDMFSGPDAPFNLAGEKGEDGFRVAKEREQAERDAEEAKAKERDQMTLFAAKAKEYAMAHRPNPEGPRAHNLSEGGLMPADVYDHPEWYTGQQGKSRQEIVSAIRSMRGQPEREVTVYRASPKNELNDGDWVSPSRIYAAQHGMADDPREDVPVHQFKVKAKTLRWPGDELGEFGYFPDTADKPAGQDDSLSAARAKTAAQKDDGVSLKNKKSMHDMVATVDGKEYRRGDEISDANLMRVAATLKPKRAIDLLNLVEFWGGRKEWSPEFKAMHDQLRQQDRAEQAEDTAKQRQVDEPGERTLRQVGMTVDDISDTLPWDTNYMMAGQGYGVHELKGRNMLYRGGEQAPSVESIHEVIGEQSRISNSYYPIIEVRLDNGAEFRAAIRVSDHGQVSQSAPRKYEFDYRAGKWQDVRPKIQEDMQGLADNIWDEQRKLVAEKQGDSLAAAKAKTLAQKEAERLAKLRATRAGFAAEQAGQPRAPFPESNRLAEMDRDGASFKAVIRENPSFNPSAKTQTVYRAAIGSDLRANDYVALSRNVAERHLENLRERGEAGSVSTHEVPVDSLLMANDATEFVYNPRAPRAPEPHILTKPEGRSAINAYHHLARTTGFPAVSIADLADQSGIPLDRLKQQLLRSQRAGSVVLSTGDWSLASDKQRAGAIEQPGAAHGDRPMLQVRFLSESGDLAAARANAKPYKEDGLWRIKGVERPFLTQGQAENWMRDNPNQDRLGFYSHLSRVAEAKLPNRSTPEQIMATLKGNGVKESEMQWMGLPQYLEGKQSVSKDELRQFIAENGVQMKEVVKSTGEGDETVPIWNVRDQNEDGVVKEFRSEEDANEWKEKQISKLQQQWEDEMSVAPSSKDDSYIVRDSSGWESDEGFDTEEEAQEHLEEVARENAEQRFDERYSIRQEDEENPDHKPDTTKFSHYALPGGTNYKEKLLTLPEKEAANPRSDFAQKMQAKYGRDWIAKLTDAEQEKYDSLGENGFGARGAGFHSSHWDEPNVLAHIRQTDHEDTEGNKVRLIEEIQSDWHQTGRKEGYQNSKSDDLTKRIQALETEMGKVPAYGDKYLELRYQLARLGHERATVEAGHSGVPDAPFKKTWPEVAFKRALRSAVDEGFDKLAWTPGKVHTDRYGTERIEWAKQPDGTFLVEAKSQHGGHAAGIDLEAEARARTK